MFGLEKLATKERGRFTSFLEKRSKLAREFAAKLPPTLGPFRTRSNPTLPWSLLDELDAEKEKFAMQQVGDTFKDRFEAADAKKKRVRRRFVE